MTSLMVGNYILKAGVASYDVVFIISLINISHLIQSLGTDRHIVIIKIINLSLYVK
jgi:hypothetical protein